AGDQILVDDRNHCLEPERIRPGDGVDALGPAPHPRDDRPVIKAHDELHAHRHAPALADYKAHQIVRLGTDGHEIDDRYYSFVRHVSGLEDERLFPVAALYAADLRHGSDQEATMVRSSEELGEAGARVELGQAEPVDRSVATDQGSGLAVAEEGVVFD